MTADPGEKLKLEVRRGALVLAVLAQLRDEHYGYSLRHTLAEQGIHIDEGTLYPLIRRLEKQGLLMSEWREENKRRKRFYRRSPAGDVAYEQLLSEWQGLDEGIRNIARNNENKGIS